MSIHMKPPYGWFFTLTRISSFTTSCWFFSVSALKSSVFMRSASSHRIGSSADTGAVSM